MRPFAALALLALAGAAPFAASAVPSQTAVYQQRTADGGVLLTDHPAPGATTERSWRVEREDPVAARQRALDVEAESRQVSERIQRRLDQQRRAEQADAQLQIARADAARDPTNGADEGLVADGVVLWAPRRLRAPHRGFDERHHHRDGRMPPHAGPHAMRLTGPAALESR
jgi:hypothetical protein